MGEKLGGDTVKRPKLSEDTVKRLPVPAEGNRVHYFVGDIVQGATAPRGFGVRVTAGGTRSFILNYRVGGRERRYTIGTSPDWSVLKAIRHARDLRQEVDKGQDPVAERTASRAPAPKFKTVADVLEDFKERYLKSLRSAAQVESALDNLVKPKIGGVGIYQLRRVAITEMLDSIEDERGPVAADRVLAYVRKALNWYATRDDLFNSPIVRGMARTKPKERARRRFLDDDEIRDVWAALDKLDKAPLPFRSLVRALLVSAARRDEVARMRWDEITKDEAAGNIWTIPAERYKTGRENVVPLTESLLALIGKKEDGAGPFVFSTTKGKRPISGYSKAKLALDAKVAELRKEAGRDPMPPWVLHDLRRTARTLMSRSGVDADVAEMVLGHVIAGVRGVYDRYAYLDEKRDALERLAALVERILNPPGDNVAVLGERRRAGVACDMDRPGIPTKAADELLFDVVALGAKLDALREVQDAKAAKGLTAAEDRTHRRYGAQQALNLMYDFIQGAWGAGDLGRDLRRLVVALNEIEQGRKVDWLAPEGQHKPGIADHVTTLRGRCVAIMDFLHGEACVKISDTVAFIVTELGAERVALLAEGGAAPEGDHLRTVMEWRRLLSAHGQPIFKGGYDAAKALLHSHWRGGTPTQAREYARKHAAGVAREIDREIARPAA